MAVSNLLRLIISKLSPTKKKIICSIIALAVYWPLSRLAFILGSLKIPVRNIPLSDYKDKTFYELRNDALDRFGTRLEQRFSREKIRRMLQASGLNRIEFTSHLLIGFVFALKNNLKGELLRSTCFDLH